MHIHGKSVTKQFVNTSGKITSRTCTIIKQFERQSINNISSKGLFIWEEVFPVSEKTFRQVYKRDLAFLRK